MSTICENIKQARVLAGLTQDQMASKLKVKRTTYANWENSTEPDMTIIKEIAKNVGRPYLELIEGLKGAGGRENHTEGIAYPKAMQLISEKIIKLEAGQEVERSLLIELLAKATGKTQLELSNVVSRELADQIAKRLVELRQGNL